MSATNPWLFAAGVACLNIRSGCIASARSRAGLCSAQTASLIRANCPPEKRSIQDWPPFLLRLAVLFLVGFFEGLSPAGSHALLQREAIALVFDRSASMQPCLEMNVLDEAKRLAKRSLNETGHGSQVAI